MHNSRILIIDDSITIRMMVEELLTIEGRCPDIAVAPDVATARKLIKQFCPTLITLDLNMPGSNGLVLLDELRRYPHAPVVVLSSATTEGSAAAREAIAHGADACFDKSKIISQSAQFIRTLKKASVKKLSRTKGSTKAIAVSAAA